MDVGAILLLVLSGMVLVVLLILRGRKGPRPEIRPLPAFQDLQRETGYAAESGGAIHIALGSGGLCGENAQAAALCPSFYQAEVVHNPNLWDRALFAMRRGVIGLLQAAGAHRTYGMEAS